MSDYYRAMPEVEDIADEIAAKIGTRTLGQIQAGAMAKFSAPLSENPDAVLLRRLFTVAGIVRFYRMGKNPELWLGKTEELKLAREFLGMPELDRQKEILREKGYL
jgi:hypothetical protein